ncbi:hypothetical protein [Oxalobacter paraformigenes]|uniref:Major capsid protein n=1 Tax=Oxalobacter paraformigenes TaxID=556268 RepID=C3X375_9BURK|nr:hypothetical protein [Oxalobacter paraformigenes]EEO27661.1 hypothetical protein OFAG_00814 [Oxalobacter paraformigenes]
MDFLNGLNNAPANMVSSGQASMNDVEALNKALSAGYGTDVAGLTGGAALRVQSLDKTLMSVIQDNKHFVLFNKLPKPKADATVDEWTEQSGIGGFLGGSSNSELGIIKDATGQYARRVGFVKYLMTKRQVSLVQTLQGSITEAETVEQQNGAKQLLTDAEFLCFEGDSSVVPTEFDGIVAQIVSLDSADHVIDAEGESLSSISAVVNGAATIGGYGNFGTATDLLVSPKTGADLDFNLDPAYRVVLPNGQEAKRGTPVRGIVTAQGDIALNRDVFIRDEEMQIPFQLRKGEHAKIAANNAFVPVSVTVDATATDTSSKFAAKHAGNYYYAVAGVNADGQSVIVKSEQVAVTAGKKIVLTITASTAGTEIGYVIYRSRLNGTNETGDFREMCRIPKAGATTTYTDLNREIPGTTKSYILNMSPSDNSITWRQLLPMLKFPLATVNQAVIPWAQLMFGYLRMAKRQHHVVIKNIVPSGARWKPFG